MVGTDGECEGWVEEVAVYALCEFGVYYRMSTSLSLLPNVWNLV